MEELRAAVQVTTGRGGRVEVRASSPAAEPASAAAAIRLRHPAPQRQEDASLSAALDPHAQRVVATLLRELDAARQRGAAAAAAQQAGRACAAVDGSTAGASCRK
ncbi:hypothetical protein ABPG75_002944 [Micractinium tetrahymenae]